MPDTPTSMKDWKHKRNIKSVYVIINKISLF